MIRKRFASLLACSLAAGLIGIGAPIRAEDPSSEPSEPSPSSGNAEVPAPSPASAEMLKSMREKGILTDEEYEDLYRRQARYEAKQRAQSSLPGWMQNWTFGGDLRFRTDVERFGGPSIGPQPAPTPGQPETGSGNLTAGVNNVDGVNSTARSQFMIPKLEVIVGAEKRVWSDFTVGFRIATAPSISIGDNFTSQNPQPNGLSFGTGSIPDPRTHFVPLGSFFSPKTIFLDRAYLRWDPEVARPLEVILGKFANPFTSNHFTDFLVWSPDIQLEGAALTYRFDALPETIWLNTAAGFFVLQTINNLTTNPINLTNLQTSTTPPQMDDRTPTMWAVQEGITIKPVDWFETGVRGTYYDLGNLNMTFSAVNQDLGNGGAAIKNNPINFLLGANSPFFSNGASEGRLQEVVADVYATFTPFGERWAISPSYQWMSIVSTVDHSQNVGYGVGVEVGNAEFLKVSFLYALLERNATVAAFTDENMFDGFTNARGWMVAAERILAPGVSARVRYFQSKLAQADCAAETESHLPALFCDTTALNPLLAAYRQTSLDRWRLQVDLRVDF
jgi:hypothetical protein